MPGLTGESGLSGLSGLVGSYIAKVLSHSPIAYWPLYETSGATATCLVNSAQNGTYTGVTLANTAGPDGSLCPYFDGANDYVNVLTAALNTSFNGVNGSAVIWHKPDPLSHNDAVLRRILRLEVSVSHFVRVSKQGVNSNIQWDYRAGGGAVQTHVHAIAALPTDFNMLTITWSAAATNYYYNATNLATDGGSGAWVGALATALIGASTVVPADPYYGWEAHCFLFDRVLLQPEITDLATV